MRFYRDRAGLTRDWTDSTMLHNSVRAACVWPKKRGRAGEQTRRAAKQLVESGKATGRMNGPINKEHSFI